MMFWLLACGSSETVEIPVTAEPIGLAECGVCGMTVNEQPSPRGQVQHRDGQHLHFCSLGDLRAYMAAPSPLGTPVGVWVETLPLELDPAGRDSSEQSWLPASEAHFLTGVPRTGIMGEPLMSYATAETAAQAQGAWGGQIVSWEQLREQGF